METFPAFFPLQGRRIVIAGDGEGAEAKARLFKDSPAEVVRLAPAAALDPAAYEGADLIFVASYDTAVDQTRIMEAEANFDPTKYQLSQAPIVNNNGTLTLTPNYNPGNGMVIDGIDGAPNNWSTSHQWYYAPQFGFAWDVFGKATTSVRGGAGMFYDTRMNDLFNNGWIS